MCLRKMMETLCRCVLGYLATTYPYQLPPISLVMTGVTEVYQLKFSVLISFIIGLSVWLYIFLWNLEPFL